MGQPIYEIPVNGGLRDEPVVNPPGFTPTDPPQYGPPPTVPPASGIPAAPPPSSMPSPSLASAPPPQFPATPGMAPPTSYTQAPPTIQYTTGTPDFSQPPIFPAPAAADFPPPAAPFSAQTYAAPGSDVPPAAGTRAAARAAADQAQAQEEEEPSVPSQRTGADSDLIAALQEVIMAGGSDLHVTVNAAPMIRVDGRLRPAMQPVWERHKVTSALYSIMTPAQQDAFEEHLELDFAFTLTANARFRVNFYQQRNAIGGAFRLIPTEIKQLSDLGIPDKVSAFAGLPRGLVLVTGPTGSGKSTTLAALLDLANSTRADHIMTVEDPIEFLHSNKKALVNQREVGHDTHSFGAALKHVLRQDPDIILIGELRDLETISVALTAAETGHLVFATLHTQDAPQTIERIIDVFPPHQQAQVRAQLAGTLQGVVCQTLVKHSSGKGRVVATEIMITSPAVANLIREGKTYQIATAMQAGRGLGMQTMDQHLADLVNSGEITHQAALEKVHDHESFKRLVHRAESTGIQTGEPDFAQFGD